MDINNFLQSKGFKIAVACVAIFVALFFIFSIGVYVGTEKANSSFKWAEQYHNNFAGPAGGFLNNVIRGGDEFMESNGVFGKIIQVGNNTITVEGRMETERLISISDKTIIKYQNNSIDFSSLKVGDQVIIIGQPNENGQIDAALIRIMPDRPEDTTNSSI